MANNTLKITTNFGNKYELAKARLKSNPLYQESHWLSAARGDSTFDLDMYISTLENSKDVDIDTLYKDYDYEYGDSSTQMAALYNETFKQQLMSSTRTMERNVYDESGNQLFKDGKPVTEKYEVTDYDYYKNVIKEQNKILYDKWQYEQELERKESISALAQFGYSVLSVPFSVMSGAASVIDGVTDTVSAIASGTSAAIQGKSFSDAFTEAISDKEFRFFDDFQKSVVDFERRYTGIRNLDGTYTNIGKYVGGISYIVGQMLPSVLLGKMGVAVGGIVGGTVGTTIAKGASIASQVIYYEAMAANNVRDMYTEFANKHVSVPTAQILSNAVIKSTLEFGVEKILGKILGGTAIDNVVFGRSVGRTSTRSAGDLTSAGLRRILKDAGQEGLEEVLQDTSSFLVDRAYSVIANENFGEISDLTWQSLMDSFVIGAIVSIGGSAAGVLKADGKTMKALGKGGKVAAWEYGLNLQSFMENYDKVIKADEKARKAFREGKSLYAVESSVNKQAKLTSAAMTEMYASYRILASIYGEIGEARFKAANEILNKITSDIEKGKFDFEYAKKASKDVYNSILGEQTLAKEVSDKLKKAIEEANITKIIDEAIAGEDVSDAFDDDTKALIDNILNEKEPVKRIKKIKKLIVTEDGNRPVSVPDESGNITLAIPINLLKNSDFVVTETFLAEQEVINEVLDGNGKFVIEISQILELFKQYTGLENATETDAVWSLMFDEKCTLFEMCLKHASIDMQAFLQKIAVVQLKYKQDNIDDAIYKKTLLKIHRNMSKALFNYLVDYTEVSYDARLFTPAQLKALEKLRYSNEIGVRVLLNTATQEDLEILERLINNANITNAEKEQLRVNLASPSSKTRQGVLTRLQQVHNRTLYSKYDDVHYLRETNVARTVFNNFLIEYGIDYTNWLIDDSFTVEEMLNLRREQFSQYCNSSIRLEINADGHVYPVSNYKVDAVTEESYRTYKDVVEEPSDKASSIRSYKSEHLTKTLLSEDIPKYFAESLTIDDVIQDPEYLTDLHKQGIINKYGSITSQTTFLYLREYFVNKYKTLSLSLTNTGTFCYVECEKMSNILDTSDSVKILRSLLNKTKDSITVKELKFRNGKFAQKYADVLAEVRIVLFEDKGGSTKGEYHATSVYSDAEQATVAPSMKVTSSNEYVGVDNTVYISKSLLKNGTDADIAFTLLHELQHALQVKYNMNTGYYIYKLKDMYYSKDKTDKAKVLKILDDLDKNVPGLFTPKLKVADKIRIASEFLYYCSGEMQAFGFDLSPLVRFYPVLYKNGVLVMPWGTTHVLNANVQNGIVIESFVSEDLQRYENSLLNLTKPYSTDDFKSRPRSIFVMPDGSVRTFEQDEHHYELISKMTDNFTSENFKSYFDKVPQISVQREGSHYYISVRISGAMSRSSMYTVLEIMDFLYSRHIEFDLGSIYYEDVDPFDVTVFSDEAENSDDLIALYSKEKSSRRRTLPLENYSFAKKSDDITNETQPAKTPKKRYVGQKEAKGTPLEKFTKKYSVTQMSPELKAFILSSGKTKVAKVLQDKIDNGTLTSSDVMDYFRSTDLKDMDDATFEAINNAFFHNNVIKTKEDLQYYLDNTASYYAARVVVRGSGNETLLLNDDAKVTRSLVESIKNLTKNSTAKEMYDRLFKRFYYKGKENNQSAIDINEKYLKWLWMEHYDGSLQQAGRIANIVRYAAINGWNITGEIKTKSLEDTVTDELTLADTIEDKSALQDMMDIVLNSDRNAKESKLKFKLSKKMFELIAEKYGKTEEAAKSALKTKRIIDELNMDQLNEVFIRQMLSDVLGLNFDTLNNNAIDNVLDKIERTPWSIVNNINSNLRTIKSKLSPKEVKLFLKHNADLFTDEFKLRPEIYKSPNEKGRMVYKNAAELTKIWERIRDLKDDVIQGAYESKSRLNQHIKFKKAMLEMNEAAIKALEKPVQKAKDVKTVVIEVADDVITVDTTKPMPKALERILDFEFSKVVKSKTQYLTNDDSYHFQNNMKTFLSNNAEYLESLTQQDVDDIIDYYTNSEILKVNMSESKYRLYNAVQLYMSVYLLRGNKLGWFTLSEEQYKTLEKRTEVTVSVAAQQLADWKAAMKMLKPEEVLINSLAKSTGIEFNSNDVEDMSNALYSGDIKRIQEAKKKMYLNAKSKWEGRKSTFWVKLLQFERIAMLSGPGTWVRNLVSNATIGGVYINGKQVTPGLLDIAEVLGSKASKLIEKLFPKKKWQREKQYKITGTVVTSEVKTFIDNNLIKSGLLNELIDGLSKYDVRKGKERTGVENLTDMVTRSIATKIFYANASDIKALDTVYKFVYKMLSDDKYVTRSMLKYLGKILVEDSVDLSQGLSKKVTDCIAEAYTMAAQDYMHKPNVWNKIDAAVKNRAGDVGYFAYKQFLPFASTSWNWFTESLNYTPVGLVKSIVQFAKLENTIDKLENARQKGDVVVSSRFAEYNVRRNIGKGVIGSIGTLIGVLLVAFGVAKLDEDDDKYKLTIGDVSVDISDLFGTQGIFLGMSVTGTIIDSSKNKDFNFIDVMAKTFDTMLLDSAFADIWNTVRYNSSLGDYVTMLPMKVLDSCTPNFFKTLSSVSNIYKVKYSEGILGKIEKLAVNAVPGLAYAFPHYVDVYTGEKQIMYKAQFITNLVNKLSPLDVKPMNISDTEKLAVNVGVNKGMLTGRYNISDQEVNLSSSNVEKLNSYYGELNKKDLAEFTSNKATYKVKNEDGTYSKLRYNQMTDKQRKAVFEQIMSKNGSYAKVYILTSNGYKYYASGSEYDELRKLGIVNVYKETSKLKGFVKTN